MTKDHGIVRFSGELTLEDYLQLHKLARPVWMRVLPFVFLGIVVLATATQWGTITLDRATITQFILISLFIVMLFLLPRVSIRRSWKKNTSLHGQVSGTVDAESVEWNTRFTQSRFPWDAIQKYREAETLLLLYTGPNSVLVFARRFFADAESWQWFLALARTKVQSTR
jgi:hypothetical protein